MRADACFTQWDVEFAASSTFSRTSRLAPLFGLVFRRSSCQHPLLAGALGEPDAHGTFALCLPPVVLPAPAAGRRAR